MIDPFDSPLLPFVDDTHPEEDLTQWKSKIESAIEELRAVYRPTLVLHELEHMMIRDVLSDSTRLRCKSCYFWVQKMIAKIEERGC